MTNKFFHFMGIGGSGMSAAANLAYEAGIKITGCDLDINTPYISTLKKRDVEIYENHSKNHLNKDTQLVVSPAAFFRKPLHPEIKNAKNPITWQKFLSQKVMKNKKTICISGTHGKSTTTAMVSLILVEAKIDPSVMVGAKVNEWNKNFRYGKGDHFIVESDEFYDNFLNYTPEIILLNNIEYDHPDYFESEKQMFDSFKKHVEKLAGDKIFIYNEDDSGVQKLLLTIDDSVKDKIKLVPFSFSKEQKKYADYITNLLGDYNKSNAIGAIKLCEQLNISKKIIRSVLHNFSGIGRRMEVIYDGYVTIIDDYAHHPTAIKKTLKALREKYPEKTIHAIVEPHSYSRTKAVSHLYKNAFDSVDFVYIAPIFQARDTHDFGIKEQSFKSFIDHKELTTYKSAKKLLSDVSKNIKSGDILIIMGAGKSHLIARQIVKKILDIKQNISLKNFNTFRVDSIAKYFINIKNIADLKAILNLSEFKDLKKVVLGEGANVLFVDDYAGLVIKNSIIGINIIEDNIDHQIWEICSGENWNKLVEKSVQKNLGGIENLIYIPGTVGAAPVQNIAAYGQNFSDSFVSLEAINLNSGRVKTFSKDECQFEYRDSVFKQNNNQFFITKVRIKLNKQSNLETSFFEKGNTYKRHVSLINELKENATKPYTVKDVAQAVKSIRQNKLPDVRKDPNAGSVFKNPVVSYKKYQQLKNEDPDLQCYPIDQLSYKNEQDLSNEEYVKLPAGRLLDFIGWKNKKIGKVGTYQSHALTVVNDGGSGKEVYEFIQQMRKAVKDNYDVDLEPEIKIIK